MSASKDLHRAMMDNFRKGEKRRRRGMRPRAERLLLDIQSMVRCGATRDRIIEMIIDHLDERD